MPDVKLKITSCLLSHLAIVIQNDLLSFYPTKNIVEDDDPEAFFCASRYKCPRIIGVQSFLMNFLICSK